MAGPSNAGRPPVPGSDVSPQAISMTVIRSGQTVHVHLAGELDAWSSASLDECIRRQEQTGVAEVRIDLGQLSFLDAAGVGTLVRAARRAGRDNWRLCVTNARGLVRRVVEITQLEAMIDHWQSSDAAGRTRSAVAG